MGKRKKHKKDRSSCAKPTGEKDDLFNPAFRNLSQRVREARNADGKPKVGPPRTPARLPDEERLFQEAMSGVTPLAGKKKKIPSKSGEMKKPAHPPPDEELEVLGRLHDLVKGAVDMDISFSDEYMEGCVKGLDQKIMKKLKRGEFPVKDYVDLHGLTRREAETRVREFLIQSRRLGRRCVLIVHGRGRNSPDSFPVLKEGLPLWLGRGPVRRIVLAFCTARPYDGGPGAIYVLLRRR